MTETVITRNALMKKIRNGLIYRCNADETSLFEFNLMILGLIFTLRWPYASREHRIIAPDYPELWIWQGLNLGGRIIPLVSLAAIIITIPGIESSPVIYRVSPLVSHVVDRHAQNSP